MYTGLLAAAPEDGFVFHVVDDGSGRDIPMVSLTTTNGIQVTTDSAGWAIFEEPGLMDRPVYFKVEGSGYRHAKDGFGYEGILVTPRAGEVEEVRLMRVSIAERMYRVTGQGIYRDSILLGKEPPLPRPLLNGNVMGQDSVQALPFMGRLFWCWGDTLRTRHPLGNFHTTSAWSDLPDSGGLDPSVGVHLDYFLGDEGDVAPMMPAKGEGVVWLDGLMSVPGEGGKETLVAHYGRWKSLGERLEHGIAVYQPEREQFVPMVVLGAEFEWQHPRGQAVRGEGDGYWYFASPFCTTRVKDEMNSVLNPASYEALAWSETKGDYEWQSAKAPVTQAAEAAAVKSGEVKATEAMFQLRDAMSTAPVEFHSGSVRWNAYRNRWVAIAVQKGGEGSMLGNVWYAEAVEVMGPWSKAVQVAEHPNYSFYNPTQHSFFDQEDGKVIYFEGTYSSMFSGNAASLPRYDYNQLMYRLDLSDPRLDGVR